MKARCDWCGIQVEVLSDGKCLLGHPVKRANKIAAPIVHEPPAGPGGLNIEPARGRVRASMTGQERRPKAPTLGDTPTVTRRAGVATATRPIVTDAPTRLPKVTDGPTQLPKGVAAPTPKAASMRTPSSASRAVTAPRPVPRPAPATRPTDGRTMRKWAPLDPFGPSGPVEIKIEEPALAVAEPVIAVPKMAPVVEPRIAAATATPATTAPPRPGAALGDALRSIDWRSGAERTRDASVSALRRAGNVTAVAASATARAGRATGGAITRIDLRRVAKRFGPLSPQNPAMWVAGLAIAGIALLIGLRVPGEQAKTQVLGSQIVAAAELTEVPGYTLEADPATEAEVAAQQPTAKKVSAANVRDGNKILARYQAIAFGPEIRWTPQRQREWLALYARGAQIPPASFTERPLGRRSVWSAPLGSGQVAVYFYGSEVMVLVTGQTGTAGDALVDAVLTARGV
jgi:hypothetical protein